MNTKDTSKVLVMLGFAALVVAAYCYARVDLGMSLGQINNHLEQWIGMISPLAMMLWSQLIIAAIAGLAYRIWRHRSEVRQMRANTK